MECYIVLASFYIMSTYSFGNQKESILSILMNNMLWKVKEVSFYTSGYSALETPVFSQGDRHTVYLDNRCEN